jgi:hypothetical protein
MLCEHVSVWVCILYEFANFDRILLLDCQELSKKAKVPVANSKPK